MIQSALIFRIAGDTALCKNIHESVSRQMRKNFAKSKWRVSSQDAIFVVVGLFEMQKAAAAVCLSDVRLLTPSPHSKPLTPRL